MSNRIINWRDTCSFVLMIGLNNCNVYTSTAFFVAVIQTSIEYCQSGFKVLMTFVQGDFEKKMISLIEFAKSLLKSNISVLQLQYIFSMLEVLLVWNTADPSTESPLKRDSCYKVLA